jgi:hypothetical protein
MQVYLRQMTDYPLTLVAYCGKHKPKWSSTPLPLFQLAYVKDGSLDYAFIRDVRPLVSSDAYRLFDVIDALPEITLSDKELAEALYMAE